MVRKAQEVGSMMSQRKVEILPVINPNDHPDLSPTNIASPEVRREKSLNRVQSHTGHVEEETPYGVGSRFSSGAASNYARHLWYVLVRIQEQEVEALESSEEGDTSRTSPSQPS